MQMAIERSSYKIAHRFMRLTRGRQPFGTTGLNFNFQTQGGPHSITK